MATQHPLPIHSVITFENSQGEKARGTLMRLTKTMIVLETYSPYSIVQLSEVLQNLAIHRGTSPVYQGKAVVCNLVNTGLMLIISATLVDSWLDIPDFRPGNDLRDETNRFIGDWKKNTNVLCPDYEICVGKIQNFLQEFSHWLEQNERISGINNPDVPLELKEEFFREIDETASLTFDELFAEFNQVAEQVPEKDLIAHKNYARQEIHPMTLCSPFLLRTYTKPLGYAGDYEMENMILRNEARGTNTYARLIDSALLRTSAIEAHRNCINRLVEHLDREGSRILAKNRRFRVLNIACGPATEIQNFVTNSALSDIMDIDLLDFNEETIDFTQAKVLKSKEIGGRKTQFQFIHNSIHALLKGKDGDEILDPKGYDFIYCAGLFDYLPDKVCIRLIQFFKRQVKPGALVVCTNVSASRYAKGIMEHLQDWHVIPRNPKSFGKMADSFQFEVITEPTGTNMFLEMRI